jgi:hypothetical protein
VSTRPGIFRCGFHWLSQVVGYDTHAGCSVSIGKRFFRKNHCTGLHERGKPSRGDVTDITKLCPQSTILDGLAVRGGDAKKIAQNEVHVRLRELEMI